MQDGGQFKKRSCLRTVRKGFSANSPESIAHQAQAAMMFDDARLTAHELGLAAIDDGAARHDLRRQVIGSLKRGEVISSLNPAPALAWKAQAAIFL